MLGSSVKVTSGRPFSSPCSCVCPAMPTVCSSRDIASDSGTYSPSSAESTRGRGKEADQRRTRSWSCPAIRRAERVSISGEIHRVRRSDRPHSLPPACQAGRDPCSPHARPGRTWAPSSRVVGAFSVCGPDRPGVERVHRFDHELGVWTLDCRSRCLSRPLRAGLPGGVIVVLRVIRCRAGNPGSARRPQAPGDELRRCAAGGRTRTRGLPSHQAPHRERTLT